MKKSLFFLFLLFLTLSCSRPAEISFRQHILPILHDNCVGCHKPGGQGYEVSGLDLTDYTNLIKGTRFGKVVIAGSSQESSLIRLIEHKTNPKIYMPHKNKMLKKAQIKRLVSWVEQGAKNN